MKQLIPKLPFTAKNGQCLPACLALILNDKTILDKPEAQPKQYGHKVFDLFPLLPKGLKLDTVLAGFGHYPIQDLVNFFEKNVYFTKEEIFIPVILEDSNHAVLVLIKSYYEFHLYDCVFSRCYEIHNEMLQGERYYRATILTNEMGQPLAGSFDHLFE